MRKSKGEIPQSPSKGAIFIPCRSFSDSVSGYASQLVLLYLEEFAKKEDKSLNAKLLSDLIDAYAKIERKVDGLLKNTLPEVVAEEIKLKGYYSPREHFCTILFSDFVGFTRIAERVSPESLIKALHEIFTSFDETVEKFRGTKIKTIGDAYMAVFGAPDYEALHAELAIEAGLEMIESLSSFNKRGGGFPTLNMRIGIHSGRVISGVVGKERMQFDVFGDSVNIASRLETSSEPGRITVSQDTYLLTKEKFLFEDRGFVRLKNKEPIRAYFVKGKK